MSYFGIKPKVSAQTFVPSATRPSNPVVGMIYNSDGTGLDAPAGLYRYTGTTWVPVTTSGTSIFTPTQNGIVPASGGGTTNFLRADGTWTAPSGGGGGGVDNIAHISYVLPDNTNGGTQSSGVQTRDINTLVTTGSWISLSGGNRINLDVGTYDIDIDVPFWNVLVCQAFLYKFGNTTQLVGTRVYTPSAVLGTTGVSTIKGILVVTDAGLPFYIGSSAQATSTGSGQGRGDANLTDYQVNLPSVYLSGKITKLA